MQPITRITQRGCQFKKIKRFQGPTVNLLKQNLWQVGPSFPGDSDIQPGFKTMHAESLESEH